MKVVDPHYVRLAEAVEELQAAMNEHPGVEFDVKVKREPDFEGRIAHTATLSIVERV